MAKSSIATAYVQILPTTEGLQSSLTKEMTSAGTSSGSSFGSGFKSALSGIAKGAAVAISAAATAAGAIVKQAVEGYADYEQLVGGVDTLFSEASAAVQEYAANAFQSAGMSANEYMETVTGFSASLIQSLGGDTEAAAEKANMAITDMSDNANKMGTDMESIQNAYSGFAKQNYTMLDNLKLGYGGTKEEMERLLEDATALSGVEYDIDSYADIVDAIHVVQTEMGITGTTAEEASSTISGSLDSMKAAWENVLVGLADPDADTSGLVDNLVQSASTFGENILPVIETAIEGVATLVEELVPPIIDMLPGLLENSLPGLIEAATSIVTGLCEALPELLTALTDMLPETIETLVEAIGEILPELIENIIPALVEGLETLWVAIAEALPELMELISENLPTLIETLITVITETIPTFSETILPSVITAVTTLVQGLCEALPEIMTALSEQMPTLITTIIDAIIECVPQIIECGVQLFVSLVENLPEIIAALIEAVGELWQSIKDKLGEYSLKDIGKNLWTSLKDGIVNAAAAVWSSIKETAENLLAKVKGVFGIASPSKVFKNEIGKNLMLGLAEGITGTKGVVSSALGEVTDMMSGSFDAEMTATASMSYATSESGDRLDRLESKLDNLSNLKVYLNGKTLVGGIASGMDTKLGNRTAAYGRGVSYA